MRVIVDLVRGLTETAIEILWTAIEDVRDLLQEVVE